jgi:hypothetical protein
MNIVLLVIIVLFGNIENQVKERYFLSEIKKGIWVRNGKPYEVIIIIAEAKKKKYKFLPQASPPVIGVNMNNKSVKSFACEILPNQMEIIGYFTSDAFDDIDGNVDIYFGNGIPINVVKKNVDIKKSIKPLDSLSASLNAEKGTKILIDSLLRK